MSSSQREFELLLAALGERDLTDWERQRLWHLLEEDESRLQDYIALADLAGSLSHLQTENFELIDSPVERPSGSSTPVKSSSPGSYLRTGGAIAAAIALMLTALSLLPRPPSDPPPALVEVSEPQLPEPQPVEGPERGSSPAAVGKETSPEAEYRSMLAMVPAVGSQQRPPTNFTSLKPEGDQAKVGFNEKIRPILAEYCIACHGPDGAAREADLRLDTREGALADGAVVPGHPDRSEIIARILTDDESDIMPPPESHKTLSDEEKQLLVQWITEGADWQEHWAFIPPTQTPAAPVSNPEWVRNPIDQYVLAELDAAQLTPNPEADLRDLARRVALDLTGLPPAPEEVTRLLADSRPDAYERFVDRLLESPHYGEHRARFWLDAARYGDTHGMHLDNYREIWPYRDWVINAFNDNMPFDRFAVEQVAGDLLPSPTQDQLIATGFSRCNVTTAEGGSIPEELAVRYMVDRVSTVSTVFLGLTSSCAQCHDHKYDPLTQKEFFQLGAFFNHTTSPAMDGNQKDHPPVLVMPAEEFESEWNDLREQQRELRQQQRTQRAAVDETSLAQWWKTVPAEDITGTHLVRPEHLTLHLPLDEGEGRKASAWVEGKKQTVELGDEVRWASQHPGGERGLRFEGEKGLGIPVPHLMVPNQPTTLSFWVRPQDKLASANLLAQLKPKNAKEEKSRNAGWSTNVSVQGGVTTTLYDDGGKAASGRLPSEEALIPRTWQHVAIRYSGGQASASFAVFVNGQSKMLRKANESLIGEKAGEETPQMLRIGDKFATGGMSDVRIYNRFVSDEEIERLASEFEWRELVEKRPAWKTLSPEQQAQVREAHALLASDELWASQSELNDLQPRNDFIYARSTTTLVMQDRPRGQPRAWVLHRGEYDQRGEEVGPGVPASLPALGEGAPLNRLGLAQWLVQPEHPLTARVTVNRFWQSLFGTGLVKTTEDFGVMGETPSHPELLDWLAVDFVASGWDVKRLFRQMVLSSTYRQSMRIDPAKLEIDPENRLLARGPRRRLDAEVLRDQALASSGLLNRSVGGESVRPYQPEGLWKVVAFVGSNTREFKADEGPDLYRRSLYTFWKRTSPPPAMAAFDAPTREECTVRRERTNTPLQALVLMNDTQFVEAARHLAERTIRHSSDDSERVKWMLTQVFGHPLRAVDQQDLIEAVAAFRNAYRDDPEGARQLLLTGESTPGEDLDAAEFAAWTMTANLLMNRDDFINNS